MTATSRVAVCSISSKNYFAHANALFRSVKKWHPDWDCHYLLADTGKEILDPEVSFTITEARELEIAGFESIAFRYDVIEFNVALKPFFIRRLLDEGYDRVIYFDVDIMLFSALTPVVEALKTASIVITPHLTTPLPDEDGRPSAEEAFLRNGAYNLGFIAVSSGAETDAFIDWWSRRCATQCLREPETGLFVDQKWIDLAPGFFPNIRVLRHPGCNMAYWNLHERELSGLQVNGTHPLVFFHFSGLDVDNIGVISKYQQRYTLANRPDLAEPFREFKETVLANGYQRYSSLPYRYGRFDNDDPIGLAARRLYGAVEAEYPAPFAVGPGTYHELLARRGLIPRRAQGNYDKSDARRRGRPIDLALRAAKTILGIGRYEALLAYLRHISVVRRQDFLLR